MKVSWFWVLGALLLASGCASSPPEGAAHAAAPHPDGAAPASAAEIAAAISSSGMVPAHAEAFREVARRLKALIVVRPVNPDGRPFLEAGHPAKGLHVKGKTATHGPHRGLIPVRQRFSKLERADPALIARYDGLVKESLDGGWAVARPLVRDGLTLVVALDGEVPVYGWRDAAGAVTDADSGRPLADALARAAEHLDLLADPKTGLPLTTDYDLQAVATEGPPRDGDLRDDPELGTITGEEEQVARALNEAVRAAGYTGGDIVKHGCSNRYRATLGLDYPSTAFEPDGSVRSIPAGPEADPALHLRGYFHAWRRRGIPLADNPRWEWGAYDPISGWPRPGQ